MKYLAILLLTLTTSLHAKIKFDLRIVDVVRPNLYPALAEFYLNVEEKPKTLRIFLNTPGGSSVVMEDVVTVMKELQAKGHTINCVIEKAYSAGMVIASACNNRFAFEDATLMWHHGWFIYYGPMNVQIADEISDDMNEAQDKWDAIVQSSFITAPYIFKFLRDKEVIFSAKQANYYSPGFITVWKVKTAGVYYEETYADSVE